LNSIFSFQKKLKMNNRLWRVNGDFTDGGYLLEIILVVDMSFPFSSGKWEN